jgi:diguanylate cyclase (GGDEF)-like protein/hemerythrin-like metal-binding protein
LARLGRAIDEFADATEKQLDTADATQGEYQQLGTRDALTGLGNRQHFDQLVELEAARGKRYRLPESLILFEIDHITAIRSAHGVPAAESLLVDVAHRIQSQLRETDELTLYGEGQFAVITPCTPLATAHRVAGKLMQAVRERPFDTVGLVTLSAGVSQLLPGERARSWAARTERLLEDAKQQGRNRVCSYADELGAETSDYMAWGEHYATGIPQIDADHAQLFRLAAHLVNLPADIHREDYLRHLDAFIVVLRQHFHDEEQLLHEQACPPQELKVHASLHQALISQTVELRRRLMTGETPLELVGDFIVRRITIGHLVNADLPLFSSLRPSAIMPVAHAARPSLRVKLQRAILG